MAIILISLNFCHATQHLFFFNFQLQFGNISFYFSIFFRKENVSGWWCVSFGFVIGIWASSAGDSKIKIKLNWVKRNYLFSTATGIKLSAKNVVYLNLILVDNEIEEWKKIWCVRCVHNNQIIKRSIEMQGENKMPIDEEWRGRVARRARPEHIYNEQNGSLPNIHLHFIYQWMNWFWPKVCILRPFGSSFVR